MSHWRSIEKLSVVACYYWVLVYEDLTVVNMSNKTYGGYKMVVTKEMFPNLRFVLGIVLQTRTMHSISCGKYQCCFVQCRAVFE